MRVTQGLGVVLSKLENFNSYGFLKDKELLDFLLHTAAISVFTKGWIKNHHTCTVQNTVVKCKGAIHCKYLRAWFEGKNIVIA